MRIDNSMFQAWHFCPLFFWEKYIQKIEPDTDKSYLSLGTRVHQLLHEHYLPPTKPYPESEDAACETESQLILAKYIGHYPVEPFEVIDAERTIEVKIPRTEHTYVFKADLLVRMLLTKRLFLVDHKTQKSTSRSNDPESWAARTQATLYLWASGQHYGETPEGLIVNVITRGSEKGRVDPSFHRIDTIRRTPQQIELALKNLVYVAGEIEHASHEGFYPSDQNRCKEGWKRCDYFDLHIIGRTEGNLRKFKPTTPYLEGME